MSEKGRRSIAASDLASEEATVTAGAAAEISLARDMIAVHGPEAGSVARSNARVEAMAGEGSRAKFWIRVLGIIQRQQTGRSPSRTAD
jgi:hypothetical protein